MIWRRPGDKPLFEPMMVSLLTHICVTRPQWVNVLWLRHTIWCNGSRSSLIRVVTCRLFSSKPFPKPMMTTCIWNWTLTKKSLVKFFSKYYLFHSRIHIWKWHPWCLEPPGHQEPWYWLSTIHRPSDKSSYYFCSFSFLLFPLSFDLLRSYFQRSALACRSITLPYTLEAICDVINLAQRWFREWLVAWWHQAITWTDVD